MVTDTTLAFGEGFIVCKDLESNHRHIQAHALFTIHYSTPSPFTIYIFLCSSPVHSTCALPQRSASSPSLR